MKRLQKLMGALLYILALLDAFLINNTRSVGILLIACGMAMLFLLYDRNSNKVSNPLIALVTCVGIISQLIYILSSAFTIYVVSVVAFLATGLLTFFVGFAEKKRGAKIRKVLCGIVLLILGGYFCGILIDPSIFIAPSAKMFNAANSWTPSSKQSETILENGHLRINDVPYGTEYPNSFLDIYVSDNNKEIERPTIFYIHGGGYVWGDKMSGDPNGGNGGFADYFAKFLNEGYNLVSVNYVFAPEYLYPTPIIQLSQAVTFLQESGKEYGISMDHVIFAGNSAGGQLAGQLVNVQTNPDYAEQMEISPVIAPEHISAVLFNSSLLDNERFSVTHSPLADWSFWLCGREYFDCGFLKGNAKVIESNVITNVTAQFPPAFISDGNSGTFYDQAKDLHERLDVLGVKNTFNFYDSLVAKLGHDFETGNSVYAEENATLEISFLNAVAKGE